MKTEKVHQGERHQRTIYQPLATFHHQQEKEKKPRQD